MDGEGHKEGMTQVGLSPATPARSHFTSSERGSRVRVTKGAGCGTILMGNFSENVGVP